MSSAGSLPIASFPFLTFFAGLYVSVCLALVSTLYSGDTALLISMAAFLAFAFFSAAYANFDIRHPLVWFNGAFTLYSLSGPILYLSDRYRVVSSYTDVVLLEYVAMVSFSIAALCRPNSFKGMSFRNFGTLAKGTTVFLVLAFAVSLAYLYGWWQLGAAPKSEKHLSGSFLLKLDIAYTPLLVGMSIYFIQSLSVHKKYPVYFILLLGGYCFVSFLIGGERSIVVQFALAWLFLHVTFHGEVKKIYLFISLPVFVVVSTLLGMFKNIALTQELIVEVGGLTVDDTLFSAEALPMLLFGSEFKSASENLAKLMEAVPDSMPFWLGASTLMELSSVFYIGIASGRESLPSTATWFTQTFYGSVYDLGGGMGFTLVGQGHLDFGIVGVIGLFIVIGIFIREIYKWAACDVVGYVCYISSVPLFMYSIRQTVSTIISPFFKHIVLSIFVMYLIGHVVGKMSQRADSGSSIDGYQKPAIAPQ